jgi:glutamate N-acetyltransferase/amino-acid N-acetyltransferase
LEAVMDVVEQARPVNGFRFAGVSAGIKAVPGKEDLGLIVAERPSPAAGVFTTNQVKAAPVIVSQARLRAGRLRAVTANSGCANCFTGKAGMKLALDSCAAVAKEISCPPELVAPCSTGVIGHLYDLEKYRAGVRTAASSLSADGLNTFARAIMTTDTVPKLASTSIRFGGTDVTIAGVAKGAGMIAPHMATLLAFIVTDADLTPALMRRTLLASLPESFNAVTIDGDMSTNDSLLMIASGAAAHRHPSLRELNAFEQAACAIAKSLARQLVFDAEGATRLATIEVRGARSKSDAVKIARQIANSPLVKTAFFGCDPNVGRIVAAAGAAGVKLEPERLTLAIGGVKVAERGMILTKELPSAVAAMGQREFTVQLHLKSGKAGADVATSDLSLDYVRINAEYMT